MKVIRNTLSRILYWLSWLPAIIYINGSKRTRLLLTNNGQILVTKGWINDGQWGLPGGGLHKNEDPITGLIREVREEIGLILTPKDIELLAVKSYKDKGFSFECHYFHCRLSDSQPIRPHLEIMEAVWVNRSSLNDHNAAPDVLTALTLVSDS